MTFQEALQETGITPPAESTRAVLWIPTENPASEKAAKQMEAEILEAGTTTLPIQITADLAYAKGYFVDAVRHTPNRLEVVTGLVAVASQVFSPLEIEDARAGRYISEVNSYVAWESLRSSRGTDFTYTARMLAAIANHQTAVGAEQQA